MRGGGTILAKWERFIIVRKNNALEKSRSKPRSGSKQIEITSAIELSNGITGDGDFLERIYIGIQGNR